MCRLVLCPCLSCARQKLILCLAVTSLCPSISCHYDLVSAWRLLSQISCLPLSARIILEVNRNRFSREGLYLSAFIRKLLSRNILTSIIIFPINEMRLRDNYLDIDNLHSVNHLFLCVSLSRTFSPQQWLRIYPVKISSFLGFNLQHWDYREVTR